MAGVKGKCGGARENTGGYRPGSGAKQKPPALIDDQMTAEQFLDGVMRGTIEANQLQVSAAKSLYSGPAAKGKKEAKLDEAEAVAKGKFGARPAPVKLVSVG